MTEIELIEKMNILGSLMKDFDGLKKDFEESTKSICEDIENLKTELKAEVLQRGRTVASQSLIANYRKGAVRWDSKGLKEYSKSHPEIQAYQKVGEPTIAFVLAEEAAE